MIQILLILHHLFELYLELKEFMDLQYCLILFNEFLIPFLILGINLNILGNYNMFHFIHSKMGRLFIYILFSYRLVVNYIEHRRGLVYYLAIYPSVLLLLKN